MQFWVDLLRCRDDSYYAGHTEDLESRLWQHQQGLGCDWTRLRCPVELVWCESAPTRDEALAFAAHQGMDTGQEESVDRG